MQCSGGNNAVIGGGDKRTTGPRAEVRLTSMPWYHGKIDRETAEELLQPRQDGLFLIRESVNFPGDFTLCVAYSGSVEHYRITYQRQRYTVDDELYFATLDDLVSHYSRNADGLCTRLVRCLQKAGAPVFPPVMDVFTRNGWVLDKKLLKLEETLGHGDFAEVFRATYAGQVVAAKCVKQESRMSSLGVKEAAVMTSLSHPNLVEFYGLVMEVEQLLLVTEYCARGSLVNYLRSKTRTDIDAAEQFGFAVDTCAGMAHLEAKHLVHRDLAARNVLLSDTGAAKVADFGLCREVDSTDCSGKVPVKWTAPEAVRMNLFTHASDMWSYGVLLWEIYSFGRLPYLGIPVREVIREVEQGYRLAPPDHTPTKMAEVMQRSWNIRAELRPSFADVVSELRSHRAKTFS